MLNITEPEPKQSGFFAHPIWNLAFRSLFLLAALFSSASLAIWLLTLKGLPLLNATGLSAMIWHTHEMLFAFGATVAVGFVLTAVQTWTGVSSVKGKAMFVLVALWLTIRALIWLNSHTSIILAIGVSLVWWGIVIVKFSQIVFQVNNQRNYLFIPIFAVLACLNITILVADLLGYAPLALHLAKTAVLLFCVIMTLVGGRVIPFFTARGANTAPVEAITWLERALLPLSALLVAFYAGSYLFNMALLPYGFIAVGSLQVLRVSRWHTIKTITVPLLWSLHLSYLFMACGLILAGCSYFISALTFSSALHLITVGAMGLMILAMMSRVSLGHTGRKLQIRPIIGFAFIALAFAALVRSLLPIFGYHMFAWSISGFLWMLAFVCFLWVYLPILSKARVDQPIGKAK